MTKLWPSLKARCCSAKEDPRKKRGLGHAGALPAVVTGITAHNANHHPRDELIRKVAKRNELLGLEQVQRARIRLAIIK